MNERFETSFNPENTSPETVPTIGQPDATETPVQTESIATDNATPEKPATIPPSPELSPEEQQEKGEIAMEVLAGFGVLYDVLPRDRKISEDDVLETIKLVKPLQPMGPAVKIAIAGAISRESLHQKPKEEFIETLTDLHGVDLWIHLEALNRSGDKRLANIRREMIN